MSNGSMPDTEKQQETPDLCVYCGKHPEVDDTMLCHECWQEFKVFFNNPAWDLKIEYRDNGTIHQAKISW